MSEGNYHQPVLVKEVVEWLKPDSARWLIDATVGGGGHSEVLLAAGKGELLALDRDEDAIRAAGERLRPFGERVKWFHGPFSRLGEAAALHGFKEVDGILMDIGVSSHQLDEAGRGFSFQQDAPLDMRMDRQSGITAMDVVNQYDETALADLIFEFGEERQSRRIAREIVNQRKRSMIRTTRQLADLIERVIPRRGSPIHPATRTFQALRIAVNDELGELKAGLKQAVPLLKSGGRLAVISFHSLEDRIVKWFARDAAAGESPGIRILTKKPVMAEEAEARENPRSRSAKLRVIEKV